MTVLYKLNCFIVPIEKFQSSGWCNINTHNMSISVEWASSIPLNSLQICLRLWITNVYINQNACFFHFIYKLSAIRKLTILFIFRQIHITVQLRYSVEAVCYCLLTQSGSIANSIHTESSVLRILWYDVALKSVFWFLTLPKVDLIPLKQKVCRPRIFHPKLHFQRFVPVACVFPFDALQSFPS